MALCHGVGGNCDILLVAADLLGEPCWRREAADMLAAAVERFEAAGVPWPSGNAGAEQDPSLLIGDAGIGLACLRASGVAAPSALILEPRASRELRPRNSFLPLQIVRRELEQHFAESTEVVARLLPSAPSLRQLARLSGPSVPPLKDVILQAIGMTPNSALQEMLRDGCRRDLAAVDLLNADATAQYLESLAHEAVPNINFTDGYWTLSGYCRVVQTTWDWTAWLANPALRDVPPGPCWSLLRRRTATVERRRLGHFAGTVLGALDQPRSFESLQAMVASSYECPEPSALGSAITQQLRAAHEAGIVVRAWIAEREMHQRPMYALEH